MLRLEESVEGAVADHDGARRDADAAARPDADDDRVLGAGVGEQLDDLVQHDAEGGHAHAVRDGEHGTHLVKRGVFTRFFTGCT